MARHATGAPFGADILAIEGEAEVLDGAGDGGVILAAAKIVVVQDLADGDEVGGVDKFFAEPLHHLRRRSAPFELELNAKGVELGASFGAHFCEAPGVGQFVVWSADGGFKSAIDGGVVNFFGAKGLNRSAREECFLYIHSSSPRG